MATDATGLKVLVPKLPGSHNGHLEVYRRDGVVVFQYEPHKGADVLAAKLAGFSGILVADAEHRHNVLYESGRVLEAGCNAHGRRKFEKAESVQPDLAKEGGAYISAIYVAEAEARKRGLEGEALRAWRQEKVPPIREALLDWMDAVEPSLTPSDALTFTSPASAPPCCSARRSHSAGSPRPGPSTPPSPTTPSCASRSTTAARASVTGCSDKSHRERENSKDS